MNEIEFVVRRILKAAQDYADETYEFGKDQPNMKLIYLQKRAAHQEIINHIREQFTHENS